MATIIQSFEAQELKKRPLIIKLADRLSNFFGSIWFLVFNAALFILWVFFVKFDPFPFSLLTLILSIEAIFLTIVVLISQQRQSHVSTIREEIDMHINRISEKEITKILTILKKIADKQGIKVEDEELDEMLKSIEVSYIERKLQEQMGEKESLVKQIEEKILPKK
jgi:uncharacterized membrane protein